MEFLSGGFAEAGNDGDRGDRSAMPEKRAETFNFADLSEFCRHAETPAQFFSPRASNLYLKVFSARQFDCPPPVNLEGNPGAALFKTSPVIHEYDTRHGAGDAFVACLSAARLATPYAFLFDRHGILFNDSYHNQRMVRMPMQRVDQLIRVDLAMNLRGESVTVPVNTVRLDWPPKRISEPCVLLAAPWCESYHHWMWEALPRLWSADVFPELAALAVVVPDRLKPFHLRSLTALGYDESRLLRFDGGTWDFDQLYVPSFPAPGGHAAHQFAWLRDRLAVALDVTSFGGEERLYVSRRDAETRRLVNEEELAGVLVRDFGFRTIVPGEMSLDEQVRAFARAGLIVGVHGAALANMAFTPDDTALIELIPSDYVNRVHWFHACARGQRFGFEIGEVVNDKGDFVVDRDRVIDLTRQMLDGG
jgi:hypothetical protein